MKQVPKVARVASWDGWCSPCEREDRPLVLTRSGPSGLLAWLAGHGDEDRCLLLTCRVCGSWQVVPPREEDDPEVVLLDEDAYEDVAALLREGLRDSQVETTVLVPDPVVVPVPAPRSYAEVAQLSAELSQLSSDAAPAAVPVLEAGPAAAPDPEPTPEPVPEPAAARLLTLAPPALPAVSAQTRAATASVLSTARAAEQAAADQRAAASRPRRVDVPRPRSAPPAPVPVAATSIALPSSAVVHQLVLARAS